MSHQPLAPGAVAAILPAAGRSSRFNTTGEKKVFALLAGRPVWQHAVEALRRRPEIGPIVIAIAHEDRPQWEAQASLLSQWGVTLCDGGAERMDSVRNALALVGDAPLVAIHDAARPLVPEADIASVIAVADQTGAACLATPVRGTLKRDRGAEGGTETVDRRAIWEALTPQVFRTPILRAAYERWQGRAVTDDAQLVERSGYSVRLVPGSAINLKITQPEDLALAAALMAQRSA